MLIYLHTRLCTWFCWLYSLLNVYQLELQQLVFKWLFSWYHSCYNLRNKLLGKYSSDRAQISTLETILSFILVNSEGLDFLQRAYYLFVFCFVRQQDLIWYFTGKGCGLLNPTTVSTAGVTLSAAGLWGITFQQKHLGKVHREKYDQEVLSGKQQGHSEVQQVKSGGRGQEPPPLPKILMLCVCWLCFFFSFSHENLLTENWKEKLVATGHRSDAVVKAVCLSSGL